MGGLRSFLWVAHSWGDADIQGKGCVYLHLVKKGVDININASAVEAVVARRMSYFDRY